MSHKFEFFKDIAKGSRNNPYGPARPFDEEPHGKLLISLSNNLDKNVQSVVSKFADNKMSDIVDSGELQQDFVIGQVGCGMTNGV